MSDTKKAPIYSLKASAIKDHKRSAWEGIVMGFSLAVNLLALVVLWVGTSASVQDIGRIVSFAIGFDAVLVLWAMFGSKVIEDDYKARYWVSLILSGVAFYLLNWSSGLSVDQITWVVTAALLIGAFLEVAAVVQRNQTVMVTVEESKES